MITRSGFTILLLSLAALALPAMAVADTILLNSDLHNESNNINITGDNVRITNLYPLDSSGQNGWQPNGANYFWVSYADTGYPPGTGVPWPSNVQDLSQQPTAIFYESFILPYEINTGSVTVWADDTARVYLGSRKKAGTDYLWTQLWDANPKQDSHCAYGPIGCEPSEGLTINLTKYLNTAGDYQLRLDAYQRAGGPFGVMYGGSIDSQPVPELSSLLLLATGLGAVCLAMRRAK